MHLAAQPVARSSRLSMSVTVGHLKVPDVTLCSTVCRGSSPPCALKDTRGLKSSCLIYDALGSSVQLGFHLRHEVLVYFHGALTA